jgi:hypothetical protein
MLDRRVFIVFFCIGVFVFAPTVSFAAPILPVITIDDLPNDFGPKLVSEGTNTFTGTLTNGTDEVQIWFIISTELYGPILNEAACVTVAGGTPGEYTYECTVTYADGETLNKGVTYGMFVNWELDPDMGEWISEPFTVGELEATHRSFTKDTRCHWKKPPETTWITLASSEEDGRKGLLLEWTQYGANQVDIAIDDGTGNFPWKITKTPNDGHEFLPNVASWQKIRIKPSNHCRTGDYGEIVSLSEYPNGWYNTE